MSVADMMSFYVCGKHFSILLYLFVKLYFSHNLIDFPPCLLKEGQVCMPKYSFCMTYYYIVIVQIMNV